MRRHGPPDRLSLLGSVAIHTVAVVLAVVTTASTAPLPEFVTYEIELVSPLPRARAEEERPATQELVVERPQPPEPEPEPLTEPVRVEEPEPEEPEPVEETPPAPPEPEEEESPATTPDTTAEATESGEGLNVRMEGLRRDYPEYYENIIRQIERCFRWRGQGRWSTVLYFEILRSGRIDDIRVMESSGNVLFDIEAQGAVECAGQGRLGPLPEELPFDRFPVRFRIDPRGGDRLLLLDGAGP